MWAATDNFESYNNGALNGNGGGSGWAGNWSGDGAYVIQSSVAKEGSKALSYTDNGAEPGIGRALSAIEAGSVHVAMRRTTNASDTADFWLTKGGAIVQNRVFGVQFNNAGYIQAVGAVATNLQTYNANTWYDIDIEFDSSTKKYRVRINDGTWSAWYNYRTNVANIDGVCMFYNQGGSVANTSYWDDICATGGAAVFTPKIILF